MLKKCLIEIWKCEPQSLLMAFGLGIMEAFIPLGSSLLAAMLINGLEEGTHYERLLIRAFVGVLALFILNVLRGWTYRCGLPHSEYCNDLVEWKFDSKNMDMDYAQLDSAEAAAIRAKIQNDYDWGCGAYFMIPQFQRCCTGVAGIIASTGLLIPVLSAGNFWRHWSNLVFLVYILAVILISAVIERRTCAIKERQKALYDAHSRRSNYILWGGITYREGKDIRLYQAQPLIKSALGEKERDQMVEKESRLEQRAGFWDGAASGILMGGAYLFIVLRALDGALPAGAVVLFASAVYRFSESIKLWSKGRSEIMMNARRMESSFAYLELPDILAKENAHISKDKMKEGAEIEVQNVSFQYVGTAKAALENVSFRLEAGKKYAVVGMNGSGKTTLVKLLCRMYDPDKGQILLNGTDIRKYNYTAYLQQFSVVFQDFRLLALPLGENVAASKRYDAQRVQSCLEKAGFDRRLSRMKKGLDTSLYRNIDKDGVEISGGEAQKIALARALYKDAPVVILDEPTAALDPIAEQEIYSGFRNLVGSKTAIFISHRLSSCRFCDEILVFHEGRLVQRGSHDALLAEDGGRYSMMWQAQAKYYEDSSFSFDTDYEVIS